MLKFPQPPSEGGLSIILPYTQGRDTENPRNSSEAAQRAGREACTRIQEAWPQSAVTVRTRHRLPPPLRTAFVFGWWIKKDLSTELVLPRTVCPSLPWFPAEMLLGPAGSLLPQSAQRPTPALYELTASPRNKYLQERRDGEKVGVGGEVVLILKEQLPCCKSRSPGQTLSSASDSRQWLPHWERVFHYKIIVSCSATLRLLSRGMAARKARGGCHYPETWSLSFREWSGHIESHRLCAAQLLGRLFPRSSIARSP